MSFFDQFRDLDRIKERAETFIDQVGRESKRQAAMGKLRWRVMELERRLKAEFVTLGERVWELHNDDALTVESITGAFDELERLADEIARTKDEMEELSSKREDELPDLPEDEPADESPADDTPYEEGERHLEDDPT